MIMSYDVPISRVNTVSLTSYGYQNYLIEIFLTKAVSILSIWTPKLQRT